MSFKETVYDRITGALAPVIRKLTDISIELVGTKVCLIRAVEATENLFGDQTFVYSGQAINNAQITYPFNNIEIFTSKDSSDPSIEVESIDLFDLLPIEMKIQFDGTLAEGVSGDIIEVDENDIIVDLVKDDKGTVVPMIFTVSRLRGSFFGKYQVSRKYELTLVRGDMADEIQDIIDDFVSGEIYG